MNIIDNKSKCNGCSACFNICPNDAITMIENENGFKYPVIDNERCIDCKLCEKVCPIINKKEIQNLPKAYACYNKDEEIRRKSSSGGIFSLLSQYILKKGGIVVGAAFDKEYQVEHIIVDNLNDLEKLRTSKYVQSNVGSIYKVIKRELENFRLVLFTGTPCQINGLLSYLGKEYENLYTQDIICHGVPSPKVWKKYLEYREEKDKEKPIRINFREKKHSWNLYSLLLQYNNGEYIKNHNEDLYFHAFLQNVCLRDSCYNCFFKDKNRKSDITLGDFWGIDNILPEMNDDKGISLVIINSLKGEKIFKEIQTNVMSKEVDFEESIQYNSAMFQSVDKPKNRETFFKDLEKMKFNKLIKKHTTSQQNNIIKKIFRKFKNIFVNKNGK